MSSNGSPDAPSGRYKQRMRTRTAIKEAAQRLIDEGQVPTVAEAADGADVSRATAYRYFPSQESLLAEVRLPSSDLPSADDLFGGPDAPVDVEDRVQLVHDTMFDAFISQDPNLRNFIRAQLVQGMRDIPNGERTLRPSFRVATLDRALEPIADELGPDRFQRLKNAVGVLIGTEALLASIDVLHIDPTSARADNAWACRLLVRAALAEAAESRGRPPGRASLAKPRCGDADPWRTIGTMTCLALAPSTDLVSSSVAACASADGASR